jgi:hypothetical protein
MTNERVQSGLLLPEGHTGSSFFHSVLSAARDRHPAVFEGAGLPRDAGAFKRDYGALLSRFEAARVASRARVDVARFILKQAQASLQFAKEGRTMPLAEHLASAPLPFEFEERTLGSEPLFRLEVPFEGRPYTGAEVHGVLARLSERAQITSAARAALARMVDRIGGAGGALDLRGHTFALLGAGAELAPTRLLLAAGARVLWIDVADPDRWLQSAGPVSGTLVFARSASNLLEDPATVVAALRRFAERYGPMHVGMFAYAAGSSREWRLCAAMDAIVSQLSPSSVRSVSMLVSPTTTVTVQEESIEAARAALAAAPRWKSALNRTGLLPSPSHVSSGAAHVARATVSIQGTSYQAAQYVTKLMAAETYAVHGLDVESSERRPLTVSANVAGITRTRSLAHPLFQAAFIGAPELGVRIFEPETTRMLSGLLILHDVLDRDASAAPAADEEVLRDLFSRQVHGGIYTMPYVLEPAIRVAALIGMGKNPRVLFGGKASQRVQATS